MKEELIKAQTIEGNKLIAEFMSKVFHQKLDSTTYINHWKYHESWDWLMEVVEKISKITIEWENSDDRTDTYYPRTFCMVNEATGYIMVRFNGCQLFEAETLIEATWLAVVDFLKRNNLNK